MFFHAFRYLPYISLSQHEMILLSTGYSWETDNRDAPVTCKNRLHFSFTRLQLGWSTSASHMEVLQVTWGASAPMYIFSGANGLLEVYSAQANGNSTGGQALPLKHVPSLCLCWVC